MDVDSQSSLHVSFWGLAIAVPPTPLLHACQASKVGSTFPFPLERGLGRFPAGQSWIFRWGGRRLSPLEVLGPSVSPST